MNREEYLKQMQALREEQQQNARENRATVQAMNDEFNNELSRMDIEYRQAKKKVTDEHRDKMREIRNANTERQHDVERRMNELKMAWFEEHPYTEVQVM